MMSEAKIDPTCRSAICVLSHALNNERSFKWLRFFIETSCSYLTKALRRVGVCLRLGVFFVIGFMSPVKTLYCNCQSAITKAFGLTLVCDPCKIEFVIHFSGFDDYV